MTKKKKKSKGSDRLEQCLLVGFALLALSLLFAGILGRPLAGDGAATYFQILSAHRFHFMGLEDYASVILQFPAVLIVKLFPTVGLKVSIFLLNILLCLHPVISLYFLGKFLKRKGRFELILFPLFSVVTVVVATLGVAFSTATLAASLFWPAFFLILFRDKKEKGSFYLLLALLVALAGSHFLAIVLSGLLVFMGFQASQSNKWKERSNNIIFGVASFAFIIFLFRWFQNFQSYSESITNSFRQVSAHPFVTYAIFMTVFFFVTALIFSFLKKKGEKVLMLWSFSAYLLVFSLVTWVSYQFLFVENVTFSSPWEFRNIALLFVFLMSGLVFFLMKKPKFEGQNVLRIVVLVSIIVAVVYDVALTVQWRKSVSDLNAVMASKKGCVELSTTKIEEGMAWRGIPTWVVPFTSVVLQSSWKIDTIVFPFDPAIRNDRPCKIRSRDGIRYNNGQMTFPVGNNYFKYSNVFPWLR